MRCCFSFRGAVSRVVRKSLRPDRSIGEHADIDRKNSSGNGGDLAGGRVCLESRKSQIYDSLVRNRLKGRLSILPVCFQPQRTAGIRHFKLFWISYRDIPQTILSGLCASVTRTPGSSQPDTACQNFLSAGFPKSVRSRWRYVYIPKSHNISARKIPQRCKAHLLPP